MLSAVVPREGELGIRLVHARADAKEWGVGTVLVIVRTNLSQVFRDKIIAYR